MTQILASGGQIDVEKYIGCHECSNVPQSLFTDDGRMRVGTKSSLVQCIKQETKVDSVPGLPTSELKTAVIVDAMFMIRQSPF